MINGPLEALPGVRPCATAAAPPAPDDAGVRRTLVNAPAERRLLVEAGPGTGKTQMAAERLAALIRGGVAPGQLLVLSFSRSAVRTLTRRLGDITDDAMVVEELRHVSIRTFDSWAFRILRRIGFPPGQLLSAGHDANIALLTRELEGDRRAEILDRIGSRRHVIIDEFQDLPGVRGDLVLALLRALAPPGEQGAGFTVLGDMAQAIYGFAARADHEEWPTPAEYWETIERLYQDDLQTLELTRNYRATADIADVCGGFRHHLLSDQPASVRLEAMQAGLEALSPIGSLDPASFGSSPAAVLAHTNGEALRILKHVLGDGCEPASRIVLQAGHAAPVTAPAWVAALLRPAQGTTVTRSQFSSIYTYVLRLWDDEMRERLGLPDETTSWLRLARASGAGDTATVIDLNALRPRLAWPDAFPDDQPLNPAQLVVTTIHQSKGQEFRSVTLLDRDSSRDAAVASGEDEEARLSEAANVIYVGVTRAGENLQRLPATAIYPAFHNRSFPDGHTRLCFWRNRWVNLEMGLRGDIDPFSFIDPGLHASPDAVDALQAFLLEQAAALSGRKVMLCKTRGQQVFYDIHLQEGSLPGRLLGRTSAQLTHDLLHLVWSKGLGLPSRIMNLRIADVSTLAGEPPFNPVGKERVSRIWLGVSLMGTGDFKEWKRNA